MRLCNYNTSTILGKLNYDGEYTHCYIEGYNHPFLKDNSFPEANSSSTPAPRLDDITYWLRNRFKTEVNVLFIPPDATTDGHYTAWVMYGENYNRQIHFSDTDYDNTLEDAIISALNIVNSKLNK